MMIQDLTHGTKEARQGTMALVQVHVDLFTTTQRTNESVDAYYKLFCARCDTVNAHGGEEGFHKELYAKAREKIIAERSRDETFMANAAGDANVLVAVTAIKKTGEESMLRPVSRGAVSKNGRRRTLRDPQDQTQQRLPLWLRQHAVDNR